ncbi:MAG: ABC-F family ATP-binding cassette domain-containing protein [Tatlockia sp.]|nr:ABC-F family ATP-binding cassette domain-containing protein [Tatlockia sp.]
MRRIHRLHHDSSLPLQPRFFALKKSGQLLFEMKDVFKSYEGKEIVDQVSLSIHSGDRFILVGANGSGKTTVGKIISGCLDCDSGKITQKPGILIKYLQQDLSSFAKDEKITTVRDYLSRSSINLAKISSEMDDIKLSIEESSDLEEIKTLEIEYEEKKKEFNNLGGYHFHKMLRGLQINTVSLDSLFQDLSGGEKSRVALAGLLLAKPDILVLDEPTNHLDGEARAWLETFLKKYEGAFFIITHDRSLINATNSQIAEINPKTKTIDYFSGGYTDFLKRRNVAIQKGEEILRRQKVEIKKTKFEIKKLDEKQSTKTTAEKQARYQDKNKLERLRRDLKEQKEEFKQYEEDALTVDKMCFKFSEPVGIPYNDPIVFFKNLKKSFDDRTVINGISGEISGDDRIVLIGQNGSGKSTLLKLIAGLIEVDSGSIKRSSKARISYLAQDQGDLNMDETIFREFSKAFDLNYQEITRQLTVNYLFPREMHGELIQNLSVGQQRRLQFAKIIAKEPNLLLLDEPTNHMDLDACEKLEEALLNYKGAILAISHDQWFINKIKPTQIWKMINGKLDIELCDYSKRLGVNLE